MSGLKRLIVIVLVGAGGAAAILGGFAYWQLKNADNMREPLANVPPPPPEPLRLPAEPVTSFQLKSRPAEELPDNFSMKHPGLIGREIARQAWLIAARDEMGLATRDETLGDTVDDANPGAMEAATQLVVGGSAVGRLKFVSNDLSNWTTTWEEKLKGPTLAIDYIELATKFEKLSRTTFVDELTKANFAKGEKLVRGVAEVPSDVEKSLRKMSPLTQFAAVRRIHEIMKEKGESPALLAGLARGYANLGILTHPFWMSESPAYSARAILYCQRLFTLAEPTRKAYWTRAYVLAMTGLDKPARDDLQRAEDMKGTSDEAKPDWVEWIDQQVRYDHESLAAAAKNFPNEDLPSFLNFRSMMGETQQTKATLAVAMDQIENRHAQCPPILHPMAESLSIGVGQATTAINLEQLPRAVADQIATMPGVSEMVHEATESNDPLSSVPKALRGTPNASAIPSDESLARLIDEMTFLAVYDRAKFMARVWSVSPDEMLEEMTPALEGHPWKALVRLGALDLYRHAEGVAKLLEECPPSDARIPMLQELSKLNNGPQDAIYEKILFECVGHADDMTNDLQYMTPLVNERLAIPAIGVWSTACPANPMMLAERWRFDEEWAETTTPELYDRLLKHPASARLLGSIMFNKRDPRAESALLAFREMDSGNWATERLADLYREQGDMEKWRAALDEYLKEPVQHLDHAEARCHIAKYLMSQGKFDEAWTYAEKAAETGAQWAMMTAAYAAEGKEDWETAEGLIVDTIRNYGHHLMAWYLWCKRTGQGDIESARKVAERFRNQIDLDNADVFITNRYAVVDQIDGKLAEANVAWARGFETAKSAYSGLMVAINHDQLGNKAERDQWLGRIVKEADDPESDQEKKLAGLILSDALGKPDNLTDEKIEAIAKESSDEDKTAIYYFVGRYLINKGENDRGRSYLAKSRDMFYVDRWASALAGVLLQQGNR